MPVEDIATKRLTLPSLTSISKRVMSHPISHSVPSQSGLITAAGLYEYFGSKGGDYGRPVSTRT